MYIHENPETPLLLNCFLNCIVSDALTFCRNLKRPGSLLISLVFLIACNPSGPKNERELYAQHCGSCHAVPDPANLPKNIWQEQILPDMGARLGMDTGFDPLEGWSFNEQAEILKSGAYLSKSSLTPEAWETIKAYVLREAPDSMPSRPSKDLPQLSGFEEVPIQLDSSYVSNITYLEFHPDPGLVEIGTMAGQSMTLGPGRSVQKRPLRIPSGVVDSEPYHGATLLTAIGKFTPTELDMGQLVLVDDTSTAPLGPPLHRPVHTDITDLDGDGREEFLVCEYGNLQGALSLLYQDEGGTWQKKSLLQLPGAIRTKILDLDGDGDLDIAAVFGQAREGVYFFYQEPELNFRMEQVISYSPLYGTSWFELADLDGDGDLDIVTAQGDNADKSYVAKPFHGIRIHLNDGGNAFTEDYFYEMNGASRVCVADMDQDGDQDLVVLSAFPDYLEANWQHLIYLECINQEKLEYQARKVDAARNGRWLVMEVADYDGDSDADIILGGFRFSLGPVPDELTETWEQEGQADLLILENQLH